MICPDCGLRHPDPVNEAQAKAPFVCTDCLARAALKPLEGWPTEPKWVSKERGRGVVARKDLAPGALIERCWVMPLPPEESLKSVQMPVLNRYLFPWVNNQRCLVSGDGLLYNFDRLDTTGREPNVQCVLRQGLSAIEFRALQPIKAGEELTWDYSRAVVRRS